MLHLHRFLTATLCGSLSLFCPSALVADPIEPALEPHATVLAKLESLGNNSCCILDEIRIIGGPGRLRQGLAQDERDRPHGTRLHHQDDTQAIATLHVPQDAVGKTIHVILEVKDDDVPPVTSHRRFVLSSD